MSAVFPPPTIKIFAVGELTRAVKGMLEEKFTPVWVEGEVSNLSRPSSGHLYLTLKDEEAPLRAVIYRGVALRMRFDLQDGMKVVVRGRLTVYEPRDLSVLAPECQAILQFCLDWRSVAEISAVLRMPLGVARILVADMSADGLVRIHQRDDSEGRPDLNLLERVLSGLRKI